MSRRIKIATDPPLLLLTISESQGKWEPDWETLRGTLFEKLFSQVDRRTLDVAIRGHTGPLVKALGIPPEGALRKMPSRECEKKETCTFYDNRKCLLLSSAMPWCFVPEGLDVPEELEPLVMEVLAAWKEQRYIVVVKEYE